MLVISKVLHAQPKEKIHYIGSVQTGAIIGKAYTPLTIQTVQGIAYKNWQTGLGIAYDPYGFPSLPVFAHVAYSLNAKKKSPFVYGDGGISIPLNIGDRLPLHQSDGQIWHVLHVAPYFETGIGYKFPVSKKNAITFNAGYSFKQFKYTERNYYWDGTKDTYNSDMFSFNYNRLVARVGFSF